MILVQLDLLPTNQTLQFHNKCFRVIFEKNLVAKCKQNRVGFHQDVFAKRFLEELSHMLDTLHL
jgi:hypothetical protein